MYENDMKIIERAQNGSKEDMTKLIEDNSRLVWSIVRRFNGRGYDIEDLYQIGSIGLINSIAELFVNDKITLDQAKSQIEEKNLEILNRTIMQLKIKKQNANRMGY